MDGKIAIIAERYISMGFELVGLRDVFIKSGDEAVSTLEKLIPEKEYALIVCEEKIQAKIVPARLRELETSIAPLIVFIPSSKNEGGAETVRHMAKRVLGVNIGETK
jgi:V/A-type H+-transporting ATPase subunit F